MKLSAHYNKASIIITISVLIAGAVIYYFTINYIARGQLDQDLTEEIEEVEDYVSLHHQLPKQVEFDEDETVYTPTNQHHFNTRFFDGVYRNVKENKTEAGRSVQSLIYVTGKYYLVTITISREGTEYLVQIIALITLGLLITLLLVQFITNRYVLNGLWSPFYKSLRRLKAFNVSNNNGFEKINHKVDEFMELDNAIYTMSARVKKDFQNLKHFTENASHEMMTPLAVITSKLDTIIQDESVKPEFYEQINDIYAATNQLSRLNQSLLLLIKIENNLIEDAEPLRLDNLIYEKVKQFHELLIGKGIRVEHELSTETIMVSKYLINILLNNLFSNAIRHNCDQGKLIITLTQKELIFSNAGAAKTLDNDRLFERFHKDKKSEGTGLGLAIIKNICDLYNWSIHYEFEDKLHTFLIVF